MALALKGTIWENLAFSKKGFDGLRSMRWNQFTDHFSVCLDSPLSFFGPAVANGFSSCDPVTCTGNKVRAIVTQLLKIQDKF